MGYIRIDKGRKDTRVLWRESYRENGKVKKKEYLLSTKGRMTYYLPLWYVYVGIINASEFKQELVKFWIKVRGLTDYIQYSIEGNNIKFTAKERGLDLRQKFFREELKIIRKELIEWEEYNIKLQKELQESVYEILDRLWNDLRELEDYEGEKIKYYSVKDYLNYFDSFLKYVYSVFRVNPCIYSFEIMLLCLILWGVVIDCNDRATEKELKQEAWIIKDNFLSNERARLKHNREVILKRVESINNKYAPAKREDSLTLFRHKVFENKSLPNIY